MEDKDLKYIIDRIRDKTGYQIKSIIKGKGDECKIEINTPKPSYFLVFYYSNLQKILLMYWKDLGNSSSSPIGEANFNPETEEILEPYQKCLEKFLDFII